MKKQTRSETSPPSSFGCGLSFRKAIELPETSFESFEFFTPGSTVTIENCESSFPSAPLFPENTPMYLPICSSATPFAFSAACSRVTALPGFWPSVNFFTSSDISPSFCPSSLSTSSSFTPAFLRASAFFFRNSVNVFFSDSSSFWAF